MPEISESDWERYNNLQDDCETRNRLAWSKPNKSNLAVKGFAIVIVLFVVAVCISLLPHPILASLSKLIGV